MGLSVKTTFVTGISEMNFSVSEKSARNRKGALFYSGIYRNLLKRCFDLAVSSLSIILCSPLLLGICALIKLESKGPILFSQKRIGKDGKSFVMYKFRTMYDGADKDKRLFQEMNELDGPVFKIKNDPRVTSIGRWMRKYSIDELPQLINILLGDMSIVGPRPPVPEEVRKYDERHFIRLKATPGLTCSWQISSRDMTFDKWVEMDAEYIENISATRDLSLILGTVKFILKGRNC